MEIVIVFLRDVVLKDEVPTNCKQLAFEPLYSVL